MGEVAELGELGDQSARQVGPDAWDALEEIPLGGPERAVVDTGVEILIDIMELSFEPTDVLLDAFLDGLEGKAEAVLLCGDHVDDLASPCDDSTEGAGFLGGRPRT